MAKNLIPQIARMLGVEVGEEFKIKGAADWMLFHFEERGLRVRNVDEKVELSDGVDGALFERLLGGYLEIVKLPWKPKMNERYWSFMVRRNYAAPDKIEWSPAISIWTEHPTDLALLDKGWVYRTKEEAKAALPEAAKEMGVDYEL